MIGSMRCLKCASDVLRPDATDRATHLCRDCRFDAREEYRERQAYYGSRLEEYRQREDRPSRGWWD